MEEEEEEEGFDSDKDYEDEEITQSRNWKKQKQEWKKERVERHRALDAMLRIVSFLSSP